MTFKPMLTAALISTTAIATPLVAQEATETPAPKTLSEIQPTPGLTADQVTDTQVSAFVDALIAIERVRVTYMPKIEATTDGEARSALIDQANAAVVEAVDSVENMSISDYIAIDKAAQADGDLNDRIMAQIAELRDDSENETTTQ
ncbi:DUF4168 domain-containing protein [Roseovarius aestuariivivens]|uniref:DUF4168 domain-containing protein n=1 Tax=Roseovarius aestuariivivens TaxID=1888910 RepID=UPI001436C69A|nr:DUF4168 domain-containing protein [Roseovarius aestuariivivens]